MFPEEFQIRIRRQQYIDHELLIKELCNSSPVSIRINPVKWGTKPEGTEGVPWCRNGWYLKTRPSFTLDPLFHAGCYYPQEASSMFLEEAFAQIRNDGDQIRVLDLCGAPGGKSTHLSALIGGNGFLVSNEVIRSRAAVLSENLVKWGLSNFIVTQSDPSAFSRLEGFFDMILVDAPCSGEGMFRDNIAVKEWSVENTLLCAERQKRILMDVWPSLKEDGMLIYSTCTFNPGENEENIKWLLSRHQAESVKLDISEFGGINEIDYEGIFGYGFYPGKIRGEGLFMAILRKKGDSSVHAARFARNCFQGLSRDEASVAMAWTSFSDDNILKVGDEAVALPCSKDELGILSGALNVIRPGTALFKRKRNNFLPSHELAMSVRLRKNQFSSVDLGLKEAISYLRRDNFKIHCPEKGWNLVTYKDVNLGLVNNIGTRFNNYYPVEWRIRMLVPYNDKTSILEWE